MFGLGIQELIIVGVVAVLLFGRKLPDVARSLGGSYREFKKGLNDIHTSVDSADYSVNSGASSNYDYEDYDDPTAPKFDPPPAEPQDTSQENA